MIYKLRTSFLLSAELSETTSKYILLTEQAGVAEPYVQKLLLLLKEDVKDLSRALTRLTVNSKVEATAEADRVRDDFMIAFSDMVDIGKRRRDPESVAAYKKVYAVIEKVGLRIYRYGYTEKSGRLAALFEELDKPEFQTAIATLKADELYIELKAAEAAFLGAYSQRLNVESSDNSPKIEDARRKVIPHLNIFLGVLSTLEVFEPEVYEKLSASINSVTAEIMAVARARKTRNEKGESSEDENSTGDGNSSDEDNPSNDGGTPDDSNNADDNEA